MRHHLSADEACKNVEIMNKMKFMHLVGRCPGQEQNCKANGALEAEEVELGFRDHSPVPLVHWPAAVCNNADAMTKHKSHIGLLGCRDPGKDVMRRRLYVTIQEAISCPSAVSENFEGLKAAKSLWKDIAPKF